MARSGVVLKSREDLDKTKAFAVRFAALLSYLSASATPRNPHVTVLGGPEGGVVVVDGAVFEYRVAVEEGGAASIIFECRSCGGGSASFEVRVPKEWLLS